MKNNSEINKNIDKAVGAFEWGKRAINNQNVQNLIQRFKSIYDRNDICDDNLDSRSTRHRIGLLLVILENRSELRVPTPSLFIFSNLWNTLYVKNGGGIFRLPNFWGSF